MIVTSMSFSEMFDALNAEAEKVKYKMDALAPKAKRAFEKTFDFPSWQSYEYTIPATNNKHILFYYAKTPFEYESTTYCLVFDNHTNQRLVLHGLKMGYKYPDGRLVMLPQVHIYTSHFFQRYNERFLHDDKLSANEIAGIYFARNPRPIPVDMNEGINQNYKQYGDYNEKGVRVNDGFCFVRSGLECEKDVDSTGNVLAIGFIYTTFMNELDMTESQRAAINKEHAEALEKCFREFRLNVANYNAY